MSWDRQNGIMVRVGYVTSPQTSNPIAQGDLGSWRGVKSSTDATPFSTPIATPAKSSAMTVRATITASKSDGSKAASWAIVASFLSDSNGVVTLLSASTLYADASSGFAPTAALDTDGTDILLNAVGVAATTINWNFRTEVA